MASHELTFDAAAGKYIQEILDEFLKKPTSSIFDNFINSKICGKEKAEFFLPKIFVWCPMTHYNLKILCPEHNIALEPGLLTDVVEKKSPRNPRLIYDLNGNILLVQRFYFCRYAKHRYLSSSSEILKSIPCLYSTECFPIKVLYRSAFSKQVIDYVTSQISQGVNFLQIGESIATLNFKDYCHRGN